MAAAAQQRVQPWHTRAAQQLPYQRCMPTGPDAARMQMGFAFHQFPLLPSSPPCVQSRAPPRDLPVRQRVPQLGARRPRRAATR
eukprot:355903-Chlamydomonas_euryale.AAC.16